jgi:SAM-dependent methyltransferase
MAIIRVPEDDIVMDTPEAVEAFDRAGEPGGALYPVYQLNATRLSQLVPMAATVLDLFCGSGRLLRHLLPGRPDIQAIGLDLSAEMLTLARAGLAASGVGDRVDLRQGDGGFADRLVPESIGAICSLSALHHCPTHDDLVAVLKAVRRLRERTGCAIWLFDLVRPDDESLLELLPRAHELSTRQQLPPLFKRDWTCSLHAGWTVDEFRDAIEQAGLALSTHTGNYSQLHWSPPLDYTKENIPYWSGPPISEQDEVRTETLAAALGIDQFFAMRFRSTGD